MTEGPHVPSGPSQRTVELGVAVATTLFGLIVIVGSLQVGVGWGAEGPKAGFFPFYVGIVIIVSSLVNTAEVLLQDKSGGVFAGWLQLRQVLAVVVPTAVYVGIIPVSGIYLASAVLIALFMKWLGKYPWGITAAVSIGVPAVFYFLFEKWFLVPLPKGPIEDLLGL